MTDDPDSQLLGDTGAPGDMALPEGTIEGLFAELADLSVETSEMAAREEIGDITALLQEAHERDLIDSGMRRLDLRDAAEAVVGSVIFATPLLVEDGIFDIADYLFGFTISGVPIFLLLNTLFVVFMTYALLEWTGKDRIETAVLFGVVPIRLLMTLAISFVVAASLMTVWGRVGDWQSPIEAIARINVLWTVGSLGAALGDIVSDDDAGQVQSSDREPGGWFMSEEYPSIQPEYALDERSNPGESLTDGELVRALQEQFDELEAAVDESSERRDVTRIREQMTTAALEDSFDVTIDKYTSRDVAEAFVGSIFFAIPFLVEDGVYDVAEYFLSFTIASFPVVFILNGLFVLLMIMALVYWAGPQDVLITRPIFGVIPRRLVGIAVVSFLTAAALMTMWGRVGNWTDPVVALARISVVWTVASLGAALGDILPGESSGAEINEDLAALGDRAWDGEDAGE